MYLIRPIIGIFQAYTTLFFKNNQRKDLEMHIEFAVKQHRTNRSIFYMILGRGRRRKGKSKKNLRLYVLLPQRIRIVKKLVKEIFMYML